MRKLLAVLMMLAACDSKTEEHQHAAKHEHKAPHGGTLIELGGEFAHLELVLDAGKLTAYVLDGHSDKPIRIEQKEIVLKVKGAMVSLQAVGSPLTGEKPGDTSQFEGQADSLKGQKEFDATVVRIVVKGKEFRDVPFNFPEGNEALQPLPKQD